MNHKTDLDTRQNYKNGWIQDKTIDLDMMRTSLVNDRCESALLGCRGLLPQKGVRLARRGAWIALRVCSTRGVIGSVWILCAPTLKTVSYYKPAIRETPGFGSWAA